MPTNSARVWYGVLFRIALASSALLPLPALAKDAPLGAPASSRHSKAARNHHVLPDDGEKDTSFATMRSQLLSAIKNHDKAFVEALISEHILTALGAVPGKKSFIEQWQSLSPESPLWGRLQRVLLHGAQFDGESNEFHAPAVSFDDSHSELPQAVVWNKTAGLHKSQSDSAPGPSLYGQQVTVTEPSEPAPIESEWAKITASDGSKGYLKSEDIYGAYDEFAVFKKQNGKWMLTWFGFAGL